ncbi:metallophosphoesterase [Paenibacillus vietnamensis]|uniref:metallophosphoesterase n=1 Tax=Paenibacillus vietnamensis TaxID=2590547 RepID=UPI001CD09DCF|nr:metallophosphoesterase [Paenibacillus vietnamensis]
MVKEQKPKRRRRIWMYLILSVILVVMFLYYQNNALSVTRFQLSSSKLPGGFESFRIVQLTDLHSKEFGRGQKRLARKVGKLKPDIIVVTGDLVDSRKYDAEISLKLMEEMTKLAPVYYVTGNHEWSSGRFDSLEKGMDRLGVQVLRNESEMIPLGDGEIRLAGIDDPTFNRHADGDADKLNESLTKALAETEEEGVGAYTVLLSHRPELFPVYVQRGMDLIFSGHAHGGQVRLPFVGGLFAPGQGFLPKYDAGKYEHDEAVLIVSRGLGNSVVPQRLFNRPEVMLVELVPSGS